MKTNLKAGDRVRIKNLESNVPNLEFTIDSIEEINGSILANGPYGGFAIDLLELVHNVPSVIELKLSQEEYETIENLAACNYTPSECAIYLDCDKKEFLKQYYKPESLVRFHYNKGILTASFEVNNKMLENAKSGNITAAQEITKAQEKRLFENHKMRIYNEG